MYMQYVSVEITSFQLYEWKFPINKAIIAYFS